MSLVSTSLSITSLKSSDAGEYICNVETFGAPLDQVLHTCSCCFSYFCSYFYFCSCFYFCSYLCSYSYFCCYLTCIYLQERLYTKANHRDGVNSEHRQRSMLERWGSIYYFL